MAIPARSTGTNKQQQIRRAPRNLAVDHVRLGKDWKNGPRALRVSGRLISLTLIEGAPAPRNAATQIQSYLGVDLNITICEASSDIVDSLDITAQKPGRCKCDFAFLHRKRNLRHQSHNGSSNNAGRGNGFGPSISILA